MAFSKAGLVGRAYYEFLEREAEAEAIAKRVAMGLHDYDPVKERLALVTFSGDPPRWSVVIGGGPAKREALLDFGVLYFGPPPWRSSCLLSVTGRLGELERVLREMPRPDAEFSFTFPYDEADFVGRSSLITRSEASRRKPRGRLSAVG